MRKLTRHGFNASSYSPLLIAGIASLLLSVLAILTQDVINPDGICYLRSAATVLEQHTSAMHFCDQSNWPFYQILIAGVSLLTKLPIPQAANLLNTAFSLGTVLMFVAITFNLTSNTRIRWLAVIVILSAHHLNAYRPDVIRDHGYWFFYLLSIYWLLKYVQLAAFRQRFISAVFWGFSLLIATLFRLEGAVSLVLLPLVIFILPGQKLFHKLRAFICLNSVLLLLLPLIGVWLVSHPLQSLGRLDSLVSQIMHGGQLLVDHWHFASSMMKEHVLNVYSASDAGFILAIALVAYYILGLIDVLTPACFALILYAFCRRSIRLDRKKQLILAACVLVNVMLTAFFLAQNFFLARRYLMVLSFILMLWVPFALDDLIQQWRVRRWPLLLAICLLVIAAAGGVFRFGASNAYVREAGSWLALHAGPHARIYSNDGVILYYAGCPDRELFHRNQTLSGKSSVLCAYDWLALRLKDQGGNVPPCAIFIRAFQNTRGGEVRIYRVKK